MSASLAELPLWPPLAVLAVAVCVAMGLNRPHPLPAAAGRYASIDGLRGYLALFVFLHHAAIWSAYAQTGLWLPPPSNLYAQFGQTGVALFFMITGFLFFGKLIDGRQQPIDWLRWAVGRVLRLCPLYFFVIALMFVVVGALSDWELRTPLADLLRGALRWLTFTVMQGQDLNGVSGTPHIVAGVTWSLAYEWLFYMALPAMALLIRAPVGAGYLLVCSLAAGLIWKVSYPELRHLGAFGAGIVAALAVRVPALRALARGPLVSGLIVAMLAVSVTAFPTFSTVPLLLTTAAFIALACGNSLFGVLQAPASRRLGEMAYSIYLLHGLLLFVTLRLVIGVDTVARLSPLVYWAGITGLAAVLTVLSHATFCLLEQPAMRLIAPLTAWMRLHLMQRGPRPPAASGRVGRS